jgi:hypothetical protein
METMITLDTTARDALVRVIEHLWRDERRNFADQGYSVNHIAVDLALLVVAADLRDRMAEAQDILVKAKNPR